MIPTQLPLFIAVVKAKTFSAAARNMGLSAAAVSKAITRLENQLKIRLFHRSTHALTLTVEGQSLFQRIYPIVERLEDQLTITSEAKDATAGKIKLNIPTTFGIEYVHPKLLRFMQQYSNIDLDVHFDNKTQDLIEKGFDISIGTHVNKDSRLIARPYYSLSMVTICSADYAKIHSIPESIDELKNHNCITFRSPSTGRIAPWRFMVNNKEIQIILKGSLTANNVTAVTAAAKAGLGIATIGCWHIHEELKNGQMIRLFKELTVAPSNIWLYYSSRNYLSTNA